MAACRLAMIGPGCPGTGSDGDCTVFYPEGVSAREEVWGECNYRNMRTIDMYPKKSKVQKRNPLKASKKGESSDS